LDAKLVQDWLSGESDLLQYSISGQSPWWCQNIGVIDAATAMADAAIEGEPDKINYDRPFGNSKQSPAVAVPDALESDGPDIIIHVRSDSCKSIDYIKPISNLPSGIYNFYRRSKAAPQASADPFKDPKLMHKLDALFINFQQRVTYRLDDDSGLITFYIDGKETQSWSLDDTAGADEVYSDYLKILRLGWIYSNSPVAQDEGKV
jgi:hypothetical protein